MFRSLKTPPASRMIRLSITVPATNKVPSPRISIRLSNYTLIAHPFITAKCIVRHAPKGTTLYTNIVSKVSMLQMLVCLSVSLHTSCNIHARQHSQWCITHVWNCSQLATHVPNGQRDILGTSEALGSIPAKRKNVPGGGMAGGLALEKLKKLPPLEASLALAACCRGEAGMIESRLILDCCSRAGSENTRCNRGFSTSDTCSGATCHSPSHGSITRHARQFQSLLMAYT
jgi:hypothetical protein